MQKLVKATLCVGVVSVSLIACESDTVDNNIIDLDQIDDQIFELDSLLEDSTVQLDIHEIDPVAEADGEVEVNEEE